MLFRIKSVEIDANQTPFSPLIWHITLTTVLIRIELEYGKAVSMFLPRDSHHCYQFGCIVCVQCIRHAPANAIEQTSPAFQKRQIVHKLQFVPKSLI